MKHGIPLLLLLALVLSACNSQGPTAPQTADEAPRATTLDLSDRAALTGDYSDHTMVLAYAEYLTDPLSGEEGRRVWLLKDVGNGQLAHDFVYDDPRRADLNGGYAGVTYGVNQSRLSSDVNLTDQLGWLYASFDVWTTEECADPMLQENAVTPGNPGLVANFFDTGIIDLGLVEADVTQVGFYGVSNLFPPGTSTLGVAYTLFWADGQGNLTDIDNNGKVDIALREIYYNDQYNWADNGLEGVQPSGERLFDFPTVAIHEVGHGLSVAHFGNIGVQDGMLVATPRTIMNAIYGGTLRDLEGRDVASYCSNWSQWPMR